MTDERDRLVLVRAQAEATASLLLDVQQDSIRLARKVAAVAALHYRCGPTDVRGYCHECVLDWPCPTSLLVAP